MVILCFEQLEDLRAGEGSVTPKVAALAPISRDHPSKRIAPAIGVVRTAGPPGAPHPISGNFDRETGPAVHHLFAHTRYNAPTAFAARAPTFMDMQTPDHASLTSPAAPLSRAVSRHLHQALAAAVPAGPDDSQATRDETRQAVRELFDALQPGDAADAQLAALAVAAAQAALDGFARAARPGTSDDTATRLRGSALAAGRAYATWKRDLRKRQPAAEQPTPAPAPKPPPAEPVREVPEVPPGFIALQPGAKPIPAVEMFQPRDRFGKPIPTLRTDLMTRAQLRASLSIPRNPALEAEALAEEAAMMAEQKAMDAAAKKDSG